MTAHGAASIQGYTNIVKCLEEHDQSVKPLTTADSDDGKKHLPSTNNTTKRYYDIFRPSSARRAREEEWEATDLWGDWMHYR
jgi:hypothetical protein